MNLSVSALGGFQVTLAEQWVPHVATGNVQALFISLVVEANRRHARDSLTAPVWPKMPQRLALQNLGQPLTGNTPLLLTSNQDSALDPPTDLHFDRRAFERLAANCNAPIVQLVALHPQEGA